MKTSALKTIIKEAVKEAIQEELKEILLEAVKTPKVITQPTYTAPVMESRTPAAPQTPSMTAESKRAAYENILGDTQSFNTNNVQQFQPQAGMDVANGTLPAGEVDMSQIAGLMSSK
jgi:hypothetical protein|tara:strand:- start:2684 stop:3034 length:351 start_codon:yes stop_codon:yes gene_type:complete